MTDETEDSAPSYAMQRATAQNWEQVYNTNANQIFEEGVKNYAGFEQKVDHLKSNGITSPDFVALLQQCDNPAAVLDKLGEEEDLSAYKNLNPVQLARALATIDAGGTYKPQKNTTPAWQRSRADINNPNLSDKEFSKAWDRKFLGKKR
jgi:hypothetical protein